MATRVSFLILMLTAQTAYSQVAAMKSPQVEEHIQEIVKQLPTASALRQSLLRGARGNGVHYPWMDEMRRQGIKRAVVWIDIRFDQKGRPKKTALDRMEYFAQYEGGSPISDTSQLNKIHSSALDKTLKALGLERALHGAWLDVPRPKPDPFVGGAQIEFFDDEWLPVTSTPTYYGR